MLADLPTACDVGCKKNSKGYKETWTGYKLHIDVACGQIPVSCVLTSASVHDSQVAIPLMTMTSARVAYLYDLMDAAYDAAAIHDQSRTLGHAPIVDRNFRADHQAKAEWGREVERLKLIHRPDFDDLIYDFRTMAERVNARLKDEFGAQISPRPRRTQGQMPSHVRHRRARRRSDHPCRRLQDRPCLTQLGAPARRRKIHLAQGVRKKLIENLDAKLREFTERKKSANAFDLRYAAGATSEDQRWELCERVLARTDVTRRLSLGWGEREKNVDRAPASD